MATANEEPLVVQFEVASALAAAFDTWTSKAGLWWPKGHTVSGNPKSVVFEPGVGGRIVETSPDGSQHVWGEIFAWDPPHLVAFHWFLFFDRSEATQVRMAFDANGDMTKIRLEQTGFASLGDAGQVRKERTVGGWQAVTNSYVSMMQREEA